MIVDIVLAALAIGGLATFLYIIVDFVPPGETALQIVFAVGLGMAGFDFVRALLRERRKSRKDGE